MITIWKFQFTDVVEVQEVEVPHGMMILDMQVQDFVPTMWAICNTEAPKVKVKLHIVGTGQPMTAPPPPYAIHIGTVQVSGMVWHYFLEHPKVSQIVLPGGN